MAVEHLQGLSWVEADLLFHFNPDTGIFTRRTSRGGCTPGTVVGTVDGKGYLHVSVNKTFIRLHRLAWFMYFGWAPEKGLDHRNNNRLDNRLVNLRIAGQRENAGNTGLPQHNTSGLKGVYWNSARSRWQVQIKIHGKQTGLGVCDDPRIAAAWYNYAAREHFGHFARLNDIPGYGPLCLQPKVETELPA
jgi:hypothetical protein